MGFDTMAAGAATTSPRHSMLYGFDSPGTEGRANECTQHFKPGELAPRRRNTNPAPFNTNQAPFPAAVTGYSMPQILLVPQMFGLVTNLAQQPALLQSMMALQHLAQVTKPEDHDSLVGALRMQLAMQGVDAHGKEVVDYASQIADQEEQPIVLPPPLWMGMRPPSTLEATTGVETSGQQQLA